MFADVYKRQMKDHAREKDTAAWLAQEYGGSNSNSLFVVRAGSPEETPLPWPKVQRRIAPVSYTHLEAQEQALDEYPMPDEQVSTPDMQEYGYSYDGMFLSLIHI